MSLRATFLLLLLANLAFFGWAALIDVAPEPTPSDSIGNLPKLKLLNEVRGKRAPSEATPQPRSSVSGPGAPSATEDHGSTPNGSGPNGTGGTAASAGSQPAGAASTGTTSAGATSAGAISPGAAAADPPSADASRRCITIGPFSDPLRARAAADVLRERGFTPRARTAASQPGQGYWVFVGGLKSPTDQTQVLQRLESNGISDAKAMPTLDAGRSVSVGLFTSLGGAERRARAVRSLGLDAKVEPRPTQEVHWVDVDLNSSSQSLPAEGLLSLEEAGSRLEIKECPAPERGAGSGTLTAQGHPRPEGDTGSAVR